MSLCCFTSGKITSHVFLRKQIETTVEWYSNKMNSINWVKYLFNYEYFELSGWSEALCYVCVYERQSCRSHLCSGVPGLIWRSPIIPVSLMLLWSCLLAFLLVSHLFLFCVSLSDNSYPRVSFNIYSEAHPWQSHMLFTVILVQTSKWRLCNTCFS